MSISQYTFLFSDIIWFFTFEALLFSIALWAFLKTSILKEKSLISGVFRGNESQKFFAKITTAFLTIAVSVIFGITTFPQDGKVLLYILNIILVTYLCMWNGWSTNKLMGIKAKLEKRNYNPHG
ncbi:MAG: hypothetical protein KAI16_00945 [Candidatus Pacebacteria bacterium]|nr:hypothetical protein [Candidatus Paceibacterota bacterium]